MTMDVEVGGHGALHLVEERAELARPMPLHAAPDDRAGGGVEGGEQGGRAVALVIVAAPLRLARPHGQHRLGAERLDLALLVDAEHHGRCRASCRNSGSLDSLKLSTPAAGRRRPRRTVVAEMPVARAIERRSSGSHRRSSPAPASPRRSCRRRSCAARRAAAHRRARRAASRQSGHATGRRSVARRPTSRRSPNYSDRPPPKARSAPAAPPRATTCDAEPAAQAQPAPDRTIATALPRAITASRSVIRGAKNHRTKHLASKL